MKTKVYLSIRCNSKTPDYLTNYLGLEPDLTRQKGSITRLGQTPFTEHVWSIRSKGDEGEINMDNLVQLLIKKLIPYKDKFIHLSKDCLICLDCYIEIDKKGESPIIGLSNNSIKFLSDIGAEFGIDYQVF